MSHYDIKPYDFIIPMININYYNNIRDYTHLFFISVLRIVIIYTIVSLLYTYNYNSIILQSFVIVLIIYLCVNIMFLLGLIYFCRYSLTQ